MFPDGLDLVLEMLANVNLNNDLQVLKWKKGRIVVRLKFKIFNNYYIITNINFLLFKVIGNRGTIEVSLFFPTFLVILYIKKLQLIK